ncbi:polygalacturonase-like [Arachis stenosperma]|uniref:polygalacturonase-like n=1 Tax=Arachis stenosperma TaxID=217475 RepID=UPI0025AC69F1|nr:polygalacturonase-like [Arachis stenosperma]
MSSQSVVLSSLLLMSLVSSSGLCFGSYIGPRRLMQTKHDENMDIMLRVHHQSTPSSIMSQKTFSVSHYGAKSGDGRVDNEAFEKAWNLACSEGGALVVPKEKVYHLKPIKFSGPCQATTTFMLYGTIKAWPKISAYEEDRQHWIMFDNITNFGVDGGGTFNGNGKIWWENSCKTNESLPCKDAPTAVTFNECNNLRVENVKFRNAQQMHVRFQKCNNVTASNLVVQAPGDSPNTDGLHVTQTKNIFIRNSVIRTGDDCISIVSGSQNVRATDIVCGPGHGISIGSLGAGNSEAQVSNVVIDGAIFTGTSNGVRIKTWQGGSGYAKDIKFINIEMRNVTNPIIIDQNYCDQKEPCQEQESAVKLSNVVYQNIIGTSATQVAIKFNCSKTVPCRSIYLQDVILKPERHGSDTVATCENVRYANRGQLFPQCSTA